MNAENKKFNFDPAIVGQQLTKEIVPAMRYTGGPVEEWQNQLRPQLKKLLGLDIMPQEKCDLNVRSLWKRPHEYGTIEKIVFSSEPGHDVPAYLCLPANVKTPYTCFICVQGHNTGMHNSIAVDFADETKSIETQNDREFGITCMKRGIAALCIEQRGFGECDSNRNEAGLARRCREHSLHAMMLGRTLLGERVFDIDRGIDYLMTRDDIIPGVGVMGASGGGTASMFAGALLDRIAYVMPSCCFCSFKDSIMAMNHCICNYVPHLLRYADASDVAALACPKPLVIVNGDEDPIFPVESARTSFEDLKNIYSQAGATEKCTLVVESGGHRFYADAGWSAMEKLMQKPAVSGQ